jgi:hypothetical protein
VAIWLLGLDSDLRVHAALKVHQDKRNLVQDCRSHEEKTASQRQHSMPSSLPLAV